MVFPLLATGAFAPRPQMPNYLGTTGPTSGLAYHNFNPLAGPTTAPIADHRSPQEIAKGRGELLTNVLGGLTNLPGIRDTPIGMAGSLIPLLSQLVSVDPNKYAMEDGIGRTSFNNGSINI